MPPLLLFLLICAPARGAEIKSPDSTIRWTIGAPVYSLLTPKGKTRERRLPPKPSEGNWTRRLLFPEKGAFFGVLDEKREELGLHLEGRRGPATAKLAVSASILYLLSKPGRVLWKKRLRERHFGGAGTADEIPLKITDDGTAAVLLQDSDPYTKSRPVVLVIDPRGRTKLELGYTVWSRIDELSLSRDGRSLAIRGLGRIPEGENWGKAVGVYRIDDDKGWVSAVPEAEPSGRALRVHDEGWVCCVREGPVYVAFDPSGRRERMEPKEMIRRFGEGR